MCNKIYRRIKFDIWNLAVITLRAFDIDNINQLTFDFLLLALEVYENDDI